MSFFSKKGVGMFRAIRNMMAAEAAGFEDVAGAQAAFNEQQRAQYQDNIPNMFLVQNQASKDALSQFNSATGVANPLARTVTNIPYNVGAAAVSKELSPDILSQMAACETAGLDSLIQGQDSTKSIRCGWLYKNGDAGPSINRGVLGTAAGPLPFTNLGGGEGKYYWNLVDAQKQVARDLCASLTNCQSVQDSRYVGKCAYDPVSGKGVPIFPNGSLMFPNEPTLSANPRTLIRSRDACPPPPAPGTPAFNFQQAALRRDVCAPLANGTYSRDCILSQVRNAGCSDTGALAAALAGSSGSIADYTGAFRAGNAAFKLYQQRAAFPLLEGALKDGSVGLDVALDNFKVLGSEAKKQTVTGLQAAARDLCLEGGALDRFDFCSELTDTTSAPYSIECLRREWIKRGGTPAGQLYPSESTIGVWNGIRTWGLVRSRMDTLAREAQKASYAGATNVTEGFATQRIAEGFDNTGALMQLATSHVPRRLTKRKGIFEPYTDTPTAQEKQSSALAAFYGIVRQPVRVTRMPFIVGVETYWFNRSNNTFLGRALNYNLPKINTAGTIPIVNVADNVQMIMLTNMRPAEDMKIQIGGVTDDGLTVMLNKNYEQSMSGQVKDTSQELSRYYPQGATSHTNKVCWDLVAGGPNVITADWYEAAGYANFELFYRDCGKEQRKEFPAGVFSLIQEPEAPFLDFHYRDGRLVERRLPALFEARASGGAAADPFRSAVRLMRNGSITLPTPVAVGAWRTLVVRWTCNVLPIDRQVFMSYGSLFEVAMKGKKTAVKFTGPNLTRTLEWETGYVLGETYLFYVNMRSSFEGQTPDIFSVGVMPTAFFKTGADMPLLTARTARGEPLFNSSDSHVLTLGTAAGISADVGIQGVQFFDYELKGGDLKRVVEDSWLRM